ncbi:MAG: hypothetical protein ACOYKA_05190 [Legionellaceae bacterium]
MNPWVDLEVEKRARLVSKGVLPTTFTGVSSVYERRHRRAIPTFPHLFTPINQPFRRYQGLFWGHDRYHDAEDINLRFRRCFNNNLLQDELNNIPASQIYRDAMNVFPKDQTTSGYCFFRYGEAIFYLQKIKESYQLRKIDGGLYTAKNHEFCQLVVHALSLEHQPISAFYTTAQVIMDAGLFANVFNRTLTHATYAAAGNSLLKKIEDNLHQLILAHPYQLASALLHGQVATFLYHVLGMFHAMISLVFDPLVELTALITRTAFASQPDDASELFPEASICTPTF